ncbi:MAG TPA: erythromycin esterase family protein [Longimicrobium sp.]|nr:erythromycin esterase family protein [Longimicrobium sp.]
MPIPRYAWRILPLAALLAAACADLPTPVRPAGDLARSEAAAAELLDPQRLLSDEELVTPEDTAALPVNPLWSRWLQESHLPIRSLTSTRFDDLQALRPLFEGKRIVQLGESGHGVREFNQSKVRLIKFLHEEMGYDVVAFESGLLECAIQDWRAPTATSAAGLMWGCVYGVWYTREVLDLFEYVRATWKTPRPLHIAGLDIQPNGPNAAPRQLLFDFVSAVDTAYAREVAALETDFLNAYWGAYRLPYDQRAARWRELEATVGYRARFGALVRFFDDHAAEMAGVHPDQPALLPLVRQHAYSRTRLVDVEVAGFDDHAGSTEARDEGMADNLDALLDRAYPGKKVVVWAHNVHVRHDQASVFRPGPAELRSRTMGSWVSERRRPELYTVGLYMYRGQAVFNNRQVYDVLPPATVGSLEALFYTVRRKHFFVDLLGAGRTPGSEWMDHPISAREWGRSDDRMVLRDQYDAILFVDSVTPPEYRLF